MEPDLKIELDNGFRLNLYKGENYFTIEIINKRVYYAQNIKKDENDLLFRINGNNLEKLLIKRWGYAFKLKNENDIHTNKV